MKLTLLILTTILLAACTPPTPIPTNTTEAFTCSFEQRHMSACIELYEPVCATINIQCVTEPCEPIKQTFSNSCYACLNHAVESYAMGEC